jgi:chromosome segregation ATPase
MGYEAFRDGSGAFERAAVLAEENERLKAENAELRSAKSAKDLVQVLRERDELRAQLEKRGVAQVTAANRIREEARAQRRGLELRIGDLEEALRRARQPRRELEGDLEDASVKVAALRTELKRASTNADVLARARDAALRQSEQLHAKLANTTGAWDQNQAAAARRMLIEERDELFREVQRLERELEQAKAVGLRGLWDRLFPGTRRP